MSAILYRPQCGKVSPMCCSTGVKNAFIWVLYVECGNESNFTEQSTISSTGPGKLSLGHYSDIIMTTIAPQITNLTVVYSTVYSDADQRKHQSSASLAFVRGIHRDRWIPRTKGQLRGKCFHLMTSSCFASMSVIPQRSSGNWPCTCCADRWWPSGNVVLVRMGKARPPPPCPNVHQWECYGRPHVRQIEGWSGMRFLLPSRCRSRSWCQTCNEANEMCLYSGRFVYWYFKCFCQSILYHLWNRSVIQITKKRQKSFLLYKTYKYENFIFSPFLLFPCFGLICINNTYIYTFVVFSCFPVLVCCFFNNDYLLPILLR